MGTGVSGSLDDGSVKEVRQIGKYQIISELTPGSLGPVYLGRQPGQAAEMVIRKVPFNHCSSAERVLLLARIRRAAWIQRQLRHPAIVRLHEAFTDGQACYLVSEHLAGTDLRQLLQRQGLPSPSQALSICRQLLVALDYAHNLRYLDESDSPQVGVLHRDLQPSVVLLDVTGRLRITSFGIANLPGNPAYPFTGIQPGTLEYLAPELRRGGEPDPRTDIYSLGVLIYELMTGYHPYPQSSGAGGAGDILGRVVRMDVEEPPRPICEIRSDISPRISRVLMLAIDRRPAIRHQSASAFLRALSEYEPEVGEGNPTEPRVRAESPERRPPVARARTPVPAQPPVNLGSHQSEPRNETVDRILSTKRFSLYRFAIITTVVLLLAATVWVWLLDGYQVKTDSARSGSGYQVGAEQARPPVAALASAPTANNAAAVTPATIPVDTTVANENGLVSADPRSAQPPEEDGQVGAITLLTKAREADQNGRFGEALQLYEDYLRMGPVAAESRDVSIYITKLRSFIESLETAKQAFERGDYRRARTAYTEALRLRPYSGFAKAGLEDAEARLVEPGIPVPTQPPDPPRQFPPGRPLAAAGPGGHTRPVDVGRWYLERERMVAGEVRSGGGPIRWITTPV